MKRFGLAVVLALPFFALPGQAHAFFPLQIETGGNFYFRLNAGGAGEGGGAVAGPWYSYYPYNAHFQTPAPVDYPFWPSFSAGPEATPTPYVQPTAYSPNSYAPTGGYFHVPNYWYGR